MEPDDHSLESLPEPKAMAPDKIDSWLRRAAMAYLTRYASSSANLEKVLVRKARRRGIEVDSVRLEPVIASAIRSGLLDDEAYAAAKTASLRRQGRSSMAVRARLGAKGLGRSAVEVALAGDMTDEQAVELFARRKRLGRYRIDQTDETRRRDLAALARAGFSYGLARRIFEEKED